MSVCGLRATKVLDLAVVVGQHDDRHVEAGSFLTSRASCAASMSPTCRLVTIRLKRGCVARQRQRLRAAGDVGDARARGAG